MKIIRFEDLECWQEAIDIRFSILDNAILQFRSSVLHRESNIEHQITIAISHQQPETSDQEPATIDKKP